MTKLRIFLFIVTIAVVGALGTLIALYARGYRFSPDKLKFNPNGLLVTKSVPDGAQLFLNGELKTATNATVPLSPGTYDVSIRKEGFLEWNKRLVVEKEVVTEITAHLFKSVPSLSAITLTGIENPIPSFDITKIAYIVSSHPTDSTSADENAGLWIIETVNLPIGFSRQPRKITDGNLSNATFIWSPNARQILLDTEMGSYLLDTSKFTSQAQRVNISATRDEILQQWKDEKQTKLETQLRKLPEELSKILTRKTQAIYFSPDEEMIVYTASGSANIAENLIKQLPGASTQKQERDIKDGQTYVYDIKEDRNFLVYDQKMISDEGMVALRWFPTSRHLVLAEEDKITILDYDGTNRKEVYSGSYLAPHAFPTLSIDRLLILTNLGANSAPPNLYSLSLK